jgi:hypothetical protein
MLHKDSIKAHSLLRHTSSEVSLLLRPVLITE